MHWQKKICNVLISIVFILNALRSLYCDYYPALCCACNRILLGFVVLSFLEFDSKISSPFIKKKIEKLLKSPYQQPNDPWEHAILDHNYVS